MAHERIIALVTGASRGVGKGVALALGDAGATVYITGRTLEAESSQELPGSLRDTAREIEERGGRAVPCAVDHAVDDQVVALLKRIDAEEGRLDILVNNVFAMPEGAFWEGPFWEHPIADWDRMHRVGLRSHYVATHAAAPMLVRAGRGLVANISSFGGASYQLSVAYGVGKAGVDRLARDMARDLAPHGVCCVSLYPGIVRTERIVAGQGSLPFDLSVSESAEFTGRAVLALARDEANLERTGKVWVVAELAREYGFTDVDGSTPPSLRRKPKGRS